MENENEIVLLPKWKARINHFALLSQGTIIKNRQYQAVFLGS